MKKLLLFFSVVSALNASAQNPAFEWVQSIGTGEYYGGSHALDAQNNTYTVGNFDGIVDFDPGAGTANLDSSIADCYITKFDSEGNFVWAKNFGGNLVQINDIHIDVNGKMYLTGFFFGTGDFDPGNGVFSMDSLNGGGVFISTLTADGNLIWAKQFAAFDQAVSIALDNSGNIYIGGGYNGTTDFDPGSGTFMMTSPTADVFEIAGFIVKLNASGNFVWAISLDVIQGGPFLKIDNGGNIVVAGSFSLTRDFDPGIAESLLTAAGFDLYLVKLTGDGGYIWAKQIGGQNSNIGISKFILDENNNIYFTGSFRGSMDFNPGTDVFQMTTLAESAQEAYLEKLDSDGNFVWAKHFNAIPDPEILSTITQFGTGITRDAYGNIYITGSLTGRIDFDSGVGEAIFANIYSDTFICKLDSNANYIWAGILNNVGSSSGNHISIDSEESLITTGFFNEADFDMGTGTFMLTSIGGGGFPSSYILKMTQESLGINQYYKDNTIMAYPNPTNGSFNIKASADFIGATMSVFNLVGQKVQEFTIESQTTTKTLDKGFYILEAGQGKQKSQIKLIVR